MNHSGIRCTIAVLLVLVTAWPAAAGEAGPLSPVGDHDYHEAGRFSAAKVELGRLLFFDKILSGNRNISCASCHHPSLATGDALPLSFGEGANGLGRLREPGEDTRSAVAGRVPRNAPALFNLGAREFTRLFHDGRVEVDSDGFYQSGFNTPAKWKLPEGLDSVLAAQAMFPVMSSVEMAGQYGENPVADAAYRNQAVGENGVWDLLAGRIRAIPRYVELFLEAFPNEIRSAEDIAFVHVANAIAAFEASAFRSDDSPFDAYLRGDEQALSDSARRGMRLFYDDAGRASCHSGKFQTDHQFHAIAMPQIGPGKGDGHDGSYWQETGVRRMLEDYGRGRVTARTEDRYRFRTPSLRNVGLTAPYGHDGAYTNLEDAVRHHLDPVSSLNRYTIDQAALPAIPALVEVSADDAEYAARLVSAERLDGMLTSDGWVQSRDILRGRIAAANELRPIELTEAELSDLLEFLESLTDESVRHLEELVPVSVPSGLPVAD